MSDRSLKSILDPYYVSGDFIKGTTGELDSAFKVRYLSEILTGDTARRYQIPLNRIADVGCGTGKTTFLIRDAVKALGFNPRVEGYDIHAQIATYKGDQDVSFTQADFIALDTAPFDLIALFDVIEHIPDPVGYLRAVAEKARWIVLHIPLDNSLLVNFRNLSSKKLSNPGHLIVLDLAAALNLVTFSGVSIRAYLYTPAFQSLGSRLTKLENILYPLRRLLFAISPYLLQRTLGGVSLMVLAQTPLGMATQTPPKNNEAPGTFPVIAIFGCFDPNFSVYHSPKQPGQHEGNSG